jgi:cardiolipin synthase
VVDDCTYAGSANLDKRSLVINYELLVRSADPAAVQQGREIFGSILGNCRQITLAEWSKSRSFWKRLWEKAAYFFLVHLDPYVARQQLKMLR